MSFFATVNGQQVVSGQLMVPLVGTWTADLQLASSGTLQGAASVVIGNLTLQGYVYRSEVYGGQTRCRLVGGSGGWRTTVPAQGYGTGHGVQLATVLGDVAAACGETMGPIPSQSVGPAFTRANATASDVLWQLVSQGAVPAWYVDQSGTTQVTNWPTTTIQTPFTVTDQRPDEGLVVIATEDYASWMPGGQFTNPLLLGTFTSGGVNYVWTGEGQFRFEVLTGTTDRFIGALTQFIQRQISPTRWLGRYAYTISNPTKTTVDATPVDSSIGLPDLQQVPLVGDSVSSYVPPDGGECHIEFLNGQPSRPVCVWTAQTPTMAEILSGSLPVALQGNTVTVLWPGAIPVTGVITPPGSVFTGTLLVTSPAIGQISTGSSKVSAPP